MYALPVGDVDALYDGCLIAIRCLEMSLRRGDVISIGVVESVDGEVSVVRVYDRFCEGLHRLSTFSHVIILYWFHNRDNEEHRSVLRVTPKRHKGAPEVGVFASRSPSRPNPIGLCVAELVAVDGCRLKVKRLDAETGSPVIDVKPYLPLADSVPDAQVPEYMLHGPFGVDSVFGGEV